MNWPFEHWHQIAIRRFNLQPDTFWDMPLRDWLSLIEGVRSQCFDRQTLDDLIKIFPDEDKTDGHD